MFFVSNAGRKRRASLYKYVLVTYILVQEHTQIAKKIKSAFKIIINKKLQKLSANNSYQFKKITSSFWYFFG